MLREGMKMPAYYGETANACALDRCMARCRELFGWEEKYPVREMGDGKVRTAGVAMAMQGSCISNVDVGSATVKLADDGTFNLIIGAADMGTGCDTILAQMVAECMDCSVDDVAVFGADTDASPYDSGSYASSTTYVTGKAVELACEELKKKGFLTIPGIASLQQENTEDRLVFTILFHSSMLMSCKSPMCEIPALLMRTSISPKCPVTSEKSLSTSAYFPTSHVTARQAAPSALISSAVFSSAAPFLAHITILYFLFAYSNAMARPIPLEAPVIKTVLFI